MVGKDCGGAERAGRGTEGLKIPTLAAKNATRMGHPAVEETPCGAGECGGGQGILRLRFCSAFAEQNPRSEAVGEFVRGLRGGSDNSEQDQNPHPSRKERD